MKLNFSLTGLVEAPNRAVADKWNRNEWKPGVGMGWNLGFYYAKSPPPPPFALFCSCIVLSYLVLYFILFLTGWAGPQTLRNPPSLPLIFHFFLFKHLNSWNRSVSWAGPQTLKMLFSPRLIFSFLFFYFQTLKNNRMSWVWWSAVAQNAIFAVLDL